jgi:hypothetical protein
VAFTGGLIGPEGMVFPYSGDLAGLINPPRTLLNRTCSSRLVESSIKRTVV